VNREAKLDQPSRVGYSDLILMILASLSKVLLEFFNVLLDFGPTSGAQIWIYHLFGILFE
jgi:hypothetical protein